VCVCERTYVWKLVGVRVCVCVCAWRVCACVWGRRLVAVFPSNPFYEHISMSCIHPRAGRAQHVQQVNVLLWLSHVTGVNESSFTCDGVLCVSACL